MRYFNQEQRDDEESSMNFYDYQDGDQNRDEDDDDGESYEFSEEDLLSENLFYNKELKVAELDLMEQELKSKILFETIKTLQNSFFWRFYSKATQLKMIEESFFYYLKLIQFTAPEEETHNKEE